MLFKKIIDGRLEQSVFDDLQEIGIVEIKDIFSNEYLEKCREFVREKLDEHGQKYFALINPQNLSDSPFEQIANTPEFLSLLRNLSVRGSISDSVRNFSLYCVLRVLTNYSGVEQSYKFHYDATVITALMPIFIPDGSPKESGDLIVFPNMRGIRKFALFNVIEKIVLQNSWMCRRYIRKIEAQENAVRIVKLTPGSLYLFWGYRTFHANFPCAPDKLRATALFHFGNPHPNSWILKAPLFLRKLREGRNLSNGK